MAAITSYLRDLKIDLSSAKTRNTFSHQKTQNKFASSRKLPISNAKAKVVLEVAGASIRKDVSRHVQLLVTASKPGPVIRRKAELLGIPVVPGPSFV